jgi:hypothetical protein
VFGFEVGSGWCELLENTFDVLAAIDPNKTIIIDQIKEKFGQLRMYVHTEGNEDQRRYNLIYWIIDCAEEQSGHICEECGEYGSIVSIGTWLYCRCKKCEKSLRKKRNA